MRDQAPINAPFTVKAGAKATAERAPRSRLFWPAVLTIFSIGYFAVLSTGFDDAAQRAIAVVAAGLQWPFWRGLWAFARSASSKTSEEDADALRERYLRGSGVNAPARSVAKAPPAR